MVVRIASVRVAPERIDEIISRYRETTKPIHQRAAALRHHYWLVDRQSGQMRIVGHWDSREAIEAAGPTLEPAREWFWKQFQEAPTLEVYEVADEF